ncbi:MAG: hypothetical protein QOG75_3279 [Mycobacterium sp.]|nr:hypothetical protein [Mycobacterium sp.]
METADGLVRETADCWLGLGLSEDTGRIRLRRDTDTAGVPERNPSPRQLAPLEHAPLPVKACVELGLPCGLDLHSLRRSYVTHLIESGMDPLFVQHQAGHEHSSTTALYTCVSSDYRTTTLRKVLSSTLRQALNTGMEESE